MVEGYRGRASFCFHGLGNLASRQIESDEQREGLIVVAGLTSSGILARIEVRPLLLNEQGFGQAPTRADSETILARFHALSSEIEDGSYERLFYRDVARGLLKRCAQDVTSAYQSSGIGSAARTVGLMRARKARRLVNKQAG